jgi:hypothetical protein
VENRFAIHHQFSRSLYLRLPLFLLIAAVILVVYPIWQPGYPWGSDTWGHLQRALYMGNTIREQGLWEGFIHSAWMPQWYLGDPARVYYPPLALWLLGPLTALVGDVFVAYRIFITAVFLVLGISVYGVGCLWGDNRWLALLGALLAILAPYTLRMVFAEGNFARAVALWALPWIFWFTERILTGKRTGSIFFALCCLWAFTLLSHVMQAAIFAIALTVYVLIRLVTDVYLPLRRGILTFIAVAFGGGLAAFYLIMAYGHMELNNVPYMPEAKIPIYSITPEALLPSHNNIEAVLIGSASLLFAWAILSRSRQPQQRALLATALVCVVVAFGTSGILYDVVPLKQMMLPDRFLNVTAIAIPLLVGTTSSIRFKPIWLVLGFALVYLIESAPALRVVHMRQPPADEVAIANILAEGDLTGRVIPLTTPDPTASLIYLTSDQGQRDNVSGWALENTPHHEALRRVPAAAERSPDYLRRMLSLWNVDYAVSRAGSSDACAALEGSGDYQVVGQADTLRLCERAQPSAFAHTLTDDRMLIIGSNATSWLFAFPFASEGESADPAAYSPGYLERYSVIGLNRFDEGSNVEAALENWLQAGNTLIVDLSGLGSIHSQGYTLFGVHALPLALDTAPLVSFPQELAALSGSIRFPFNEGAWVGATYYNLDNVVATLTYQGEDYPLLGYKNVGSGRVWFVAFNLFYLLDITGQKDAIRPLTDYLLVDSSVNRSLELPLFDMELLERTADRIQFRYAEDEPVSAVLSMTYFPRWQVDVDGSSIALQSHERLIRLDLPAGEHLVTLTYQPYGRVASLSAAVSAASLLIVLGSIYLMQRRPVLARADREGAFEERLPQPQLGPQPEFRHEVCPSCGYPQAIAGPPTAATYPFISIHCPECGFNLDDMGEWLPETESR